MGKIIECTMPGYPTVKIAQRDHPLDKFLYDFTGHFNYYMLDLNWLLYIKPGDLVIDIGAYDGDTSLVMGLLTGKTGRVIAFEPNPSAYITLLENVELNKDIMNITPLPFAVTSKTGPVYLYDHGNNWCNSGVEEKFGLEESIEVWGHTLTGYLKQNDRPSFIKMDCEGYDKEILKSHYSLIKRHKPVLFVEWFLRFSEEETDDLFKTIYKLNYVPCNPTTLQLAKRDKYIPDLICFPKERYEKR